MYITELEMPLLRELEKLRNKDEVDKVFNMLDLLAVARRKKATHPDLNELEFVYGFSDAPYPLMCLVVKLETVRERHELRQRLDQIRAQVPPFDIFDPDRLGLNKPDWM